MRVPHDTGWHALINKTLSEKPVDKIEETNRELSQYSSISNRTDTLTEKRLRQGKDRSSKLPKRHRFPPSLLTSRAADFWKTLMPLRANCSCSSISLGNECSRLSFGVSFSDTTVGSSDNSISPFNEVASPRTFGETLECTQQAFELLVARMGRLMNVLNEGTDLSSTHVFSDSNLEILSPLSRKSENTVDITVGDSLCRFSSIASLSNNSTNHYYERKWQSSSTIEITEQINRIKNPFSQNSSEISENVLTEEELTFLLRYKRSLISEYFRCEVDSKDLKNKSDTSSERRALIYATQSDSRLQEHSLVRFVQFIRSRKKQEAEDVSEENTHMTDNLESKTDKFSIPKRRVTFSNPLAENSTSSLNCFSIENDEEVSSVDSFTSTITNDAKKSCEDYPEPEISLESKSSSDLNLPVSLKACNVNLSLNSLSSRADYPETKMIHSMNLLENEVVRNEMTGEESEVKLDVLSTVPVQKPLPSVAEDRPMKAQRSTPPNSLTPRKSVQNDVKVINKNKKLKSSKFLMKEPLDCDTTHVPISNEVEEVRTRKGDDGIWRVTFEGRRSQHQNSEGRFEKMDSLYQVLDPAGDCSFIANENCTQICEPKNESVVICKSNEISERLTPSSSDEFEISDSEYNCDPSIPPGKTVTFQDYCQTISDQSIRRYNEEELIEPSSRSDDRPTPSSVDPGWFELSWKGCWEQKNVRNGEKQIVNSNQTEIMTKVAEFTVIEEQKGEPEEFSSNEKPFAIPCSRQTSYYTTLEGEIKSANDSGSEYESNNVFTADSNGWGKCEAKDKDISKACKPVSKFYDDLCSDKEVINFPNRGDLARGLADVYQRIRNPEIWRSEVQTLAKPDWWYTACNCERYSCKKKPKAESDWLMRRLEELKSNSDADYESDYYADSELESDFEWTKDFSPLNRSLSEIDIRSYSECSKKFGTKKKDKRNKNIFLDKVLSGRKLLFRGCRCRNNLPRTRYDLKPRELKLRHSSFRDPDEERSSKNLFSNIRAKIILDSETDDSDNFSPSIQPDFNCRNEYVNKIKCRRFVKSLKSAGAGGLGLIRKSNCDRQFSSSELLHVAFQRSFNPAGVQTELSTRTVATNIFEEQNHCCSVMDVCIDTNDLCHKKSIGTINRASDFILETKDGNSQTLKSYLDALNSVHSEESSPERFPVLIRKETSSGSNSQKYKNSGQKFSNVIDNLSAQINNASNNLAKFRFSEVEIAPEAFAVSPPIKEDNFNTVEYFGTCQRSIEEANQPERPTSEILSNISSSKSRVENPPENISIDTSSRIPENSNCPICNSGKKKSAPRYVLPACVVRGVTPDQRINENDPWNRVMERAKIQHRYEIRDTATSLKFQQTELNPFSNNEFHRREESTNVNHPSRVEDNSAHDDAINHVQDHHDPAAFNNKFSRTRGPRLPHLDILNADFFTLVDAEPTEIVSSSRPFFDAFSLSSP